MTNNRPRYEKEGRQMKKSENAAALEFPATAWANAPARAEFKLGFFPTDYHVPPATPTPPARDTGKMK